MDPMGLVVAQPSPQHDENHQPPTVKPRISEPSTTSPETADESMGP